MDIHTAYAYAKERYAAIGVDTDAAIAKTLTTPVSLHCWQGDDVRGFEGLETGLTGGIMSTGEYPGRARTPDELRADLDCALRLIPGENKVNIHAFYLEAGKAVERDAITSAHFSNWADWAVGKNIGLDFNPTCFSHPMSASGYTLASADDGIRRYWIEHAKRCREIAEYLGQRTGKCCVNNLWIADGCKERPIDTLGPRLRLFDALNEIYANHCDHMKDAVESKLFGIGSESYVVGSHEFYLAYAAQHPEVLLTLDTGHFHPTETVSAKLTACFVFLKELLLHVSRPVRWDSDHVVTFDDELQAIFHELIRSDCLSRTNIALDYFDGSINRVAAWVIGARNTKKALLKALLEPVADLKTAENAGDTTARLGLTEEYKTFPFGIVWDYLCEKENMPGGAEWLPFVKDYEQNIQKTRK